MKFSCYEKFVLELFLTLGFAVYFSKPRMAAVVETSPALEILVREPEGYSIWNGPPFSNSNQPRMVPSLVRMVPGLWPSIRFSYDEAVACRLATNEIQFSDAADFSKGILHRLRIPGVAAVELSKAPGSHVAAFVPESKGSPASVQIYACGKDLHSQPLARRSFFRCSTVLLNWNHGSTGLLVMVQSDVDKANQSYYGESKLNYLTSDGTHEGLVRLRKEGPIHDVQWSYSGKEFAVVYGFLWANLLQGMLFDLAVAQTWLCLQVQQYLTRSANHCLSWDPVLIIPFDGIQRGNFCVWLVLVTCLVTCIKIFINNGSLFFKKMFDKLFQTDWKPELPDKFGEIAELVKSIDSMKVEETKSEGQGSTSKKPASANPPAQKPAAYRPPHAKNAAAVQAEVFSDNYGVSYNDNSNEMQLLNKKQMRRNR
ncbi:hypothetical protein CRYUN_Cryun36dG0011400 [Craigia yunnanensis]